MPLEENWIWSEISYLLSNGVTFVMRSFCGLIGASGRLVKKTMQSLLSLSHTHGDVYTRDIKYH